MASKERHVVLLVISHWDNPKKPGTGFEVQVVHEIGADQKSWGAGVRKVYFYDEGRKKIPKILQRKDFTVIGQKWKEIQPLLDNPGPVPPLPEAAPPEPRKEDVPETPW